MMTAYRDDAQLPNVHQPKRMRQPECDFLVWLLIVSVAALGVAVSALAYLLWGKQHRAVATEQLYERPQWYDLSTKNCSFTTAPAGILFIHFHIPKSGGSTIEKLHKSFCRPAAAHGRKCLFYPKLGHWGFASIDWKISNGITHFVEVFGHEPGCVQIITELREPVFRIQSAFYAARARRVHFGGSVPDPPCTHIRCFDDKSIRMIDNYSLTMADALMSGMNYQRNSLTLFLGNLSVAGAADFYRNISFVFRTQNLKEDIQLFALRYGFGFNSSTYFYAEFLEHRIACKNLWPEPPMSETEIRFILNQNTQDNLVYEAGMAVWEPRWQALKSHFQHELASRYYLCNTQDVRHKGECGGRGKRQCQLVPRPRVHTTNVSYIR